MLKIRLLKSFEAALDEASLMGLGNQVRRLLISLVLHADTWVDKDALAHELKTVRWSKQGRSVSKLNNDNLRQQIHRLSHSLGNEAGRLQGGNGTVRLNLDGADVDILNFRRLVSQGTPIALEQAIALYRGDLLAQEQETANYWKEEWEPWVAPFRTELRQMYLSAQEKLQAAGRTRAIPAALPRLEFPGGGVPLDSPFYIKRLQDAELDALLADPSALRQSGQTLLVKGARQMGKTSLLHRVLHQARQAEMRVVHSDWQNLADSETDSPEDLFFAFADAFAYQLQLDTPPEDTFHTRRSPSTNFDRYIRSHVLISQTPVVWIVDEADRLFPCPFRNDIFGKLRAWHNERSQTDSPLRRLTVLLAYSTAAHYFIQDPNMSPFNVGKKITLHDFTPEQTAELNLCHGSPLPNSEQVSRLHDLTGGQPYLVRLCLHALCEQRLPLADIEQQTEYPAGIFSEHLAHIRGVLSRDPELEAVVRSFVRQQIVPSEHDFLRLCAAGLMSGHSPQEMRPRCMLYQHFLERYLS